MRPDRRQARRWRWAVVLAVAAGILVLSLVPVPSENLDGGVGPADKAAHAIGYAVLGLAGIRAIALDPRLTHRTGRSIAGVPVTVGATGLAGAVVLAVAAFGGGIELLQLAVPGRQFAVADGVANAVGATVGVGWWTGRRRTRGRSTGRERAGSDVGR